MAKETTKLATADELPEVPPASKWQWIKDHVWIHRPLYIWLPVILLGIWGMLHGYAALTGRAPVDDLPVGALGNLLIIIVAVILTNWTKPRLFDDIDTTIAGTAWWRICVDTFETCFLLALFCYVLTH